MEETINLLAQALEALEFLHARGVTHRDLKPETILVETRSPFRTKLADFGLASDKSELKTFCGTRRYAAPEIYSNRKYTPSVDLWSLGVIMLQYAYGLPPDIRERRGKHKNQHSMMKEWAHTWCHCIVDEANNWDSEALIDLLTSGLLRIPPEERLSAQDCLRKGRDLGLFDHHTVNSGCATPTQQTALHGNIGDDDGSSTIILGALWDPDTVLNHNDNNRTERLRPSRASGFLQPWTTEIPGAPSNGYGRRSQLSKRQQSPAGPPAKSSSRRERVKRRRENVRG